MTTLEYRLITGISTGIKELLDSEDIAVDWDDYSGTYEAKVSWYSLGAVEPDKAEEFGKKLMLASKVAEILNEYEIKAVYKVNEDELPFEELKEIVSLIAKNGDYCFEDIMDMVVEKYGKEA